MSQTMPQQVTALPILGRQLDILIPIGFHDNQGKTWRSTEEAISLYTPMHSLSAISLLSLMRVGADHSWLQSVSPDSRSFLWLTVLFCLILEDISLSFSLPSSLSLSFSLRYGDDLALTHSSTLSFSFKPNTPRPSSQFHSFQKMSGLE